MNDQPRLASLEQSRENVLKEAAAGALLGAAMDLFKADSTPKADLKDFRDRLANQTQGEKEPGLDPIIEKGTSLIKDLDKALKSVSDGKTRNELETMRVTAGLNQCHALSNCFEDIAAMARKEPMFKTEVMQELITVMKLSADTVKNEQLHELAHKYKALSDKDFAEAFEKAGGKTEDIKMVGIRAETEDLVFGVNNGTARRERVCKAIDELLKGNTKYQGELSKDRVQMALMLANDYIYRALNQKDPQLSAAAEKQAIEELKTCLKLNPNVINGEWWPVRDGSATLLGSFDSFRLCCNAHKDPEFAKLYETALRKKR